MGGEPCFSFEVAAGSSAVSFHSSARKTSLLASRHGFAREKRHRDSLPLVSQCSHRDPAALGESSGCHSEVETWENILDNLAPCLF